MPLNIRNARTEQTIRELAALTGECVTAPIQGAAEEPVSRLRLAGVGGSVAKELRAVGRRCAALPDLDTRPADEILGYDEHGAPR